MRISGRHAIAATTLASLLALQVASPASAAVQFGRDPGNTAVFPSFPHQAAALPAPSERVHLLYHLPLRNRAELESLTVQQGTPGSPMFHHWFTPAQFRARYAPDAASVGAAVQALRSSGLSVDRVGSQLIYASAPVTTIERNFSTRLVAARDGSGRFISAGQSYRLPAALAALHGTLMGLSNHLRATPDFALRDGVGRPTPDNRYSAVGGYFFDDLKQAYNYPEYSEGNGGAPAGSKGAAAVPRHIGIVGASDFNESDAFNYFAFEGVSIIPNALALPPVLNHIDYPGSNPWSAGSGDSIEADLDVQQAGGSAPGAVIDHYSVDSSYAEDFLPAYGDIVDYGVDDIISTSYGGCELYFTSAYNEGVDFTEILQAYHDIFLQGNLEGQTFVFSSGDEAGRGCAPAAFFEQQKKATTFATVPGAQFWANDPAVTAVGGTNLTTTYVKGSLESAYVSEQAIADYPRAEEESNVGNFLDGIYWGSGGGQSVIWARPSYQSPSAVNKFSGKGRLVPDISMHMGGCPGDVQKTAPCLNPKNQNNPGDDSFDYAGHDGLFYGVIGTSASAPEFAGLLAVVEQSIGGKRLGNVNTLLYAYAKPPYVHQGIPATDGVPGYSVAKGKLGYNVITGLGTPDLIPFLELLTKKSLVPAGNPQTKGNP